MSMTYLQLAARLRLEVGGSGTGPTSVTSQTGEYGRFVAWVATADEDIQRMHNEWLFMRGSFTVNTVASTGTYTPTTCGITSFRDWRKDTLKIYLTASGVATETPLYFIDYQTWYDSYNTGTQTNGRPSVYTIGNDQSLIVAPKPDAVYTITGEYQKAVTSLALAADVPAYPAEFHMLAVYKAMVKHGLYLGASEIVQRGKEEYKTLLKEMRRTQLPKTKLGAPLA